MKKKVIIGIIVIVLLILLVPMPMHLRDGGTVVYKALIYKISKVHRLTGNLEKMYEDGIIIEILGLEIYNNVKSNKIVNEESYLYLTIRQFQEEEVKTVCKGDLRYERWKNTKFKYDTSNIKL